MESERLYDCLITYHLNSGQLLSDSFRNDIPSEVWDSVKDGLDDGADFLELEPNDTFVKVLLPKSNISYITMKVLAST